jgi:hypothetical protein
MITYTPEFSGWLIAQYYFLCGGEHDLLVVGHCLYGRLGKRKLSETGCCQGQLSSSLEPHHQISITIDLQIESKLHLTNNLGVKTGFCEKCQVLEKSCAISGCGHQETSTFLHQRSDKIISTQCLVERARLSRKVKFEIIHS